MANDAMNNTATELDMGDLDIVSGGVDRSSKSVGDLTEIIINWIFGD